MTQEEAWSESWTVESWALTLPGSVSVCRRDRSEGRQERKRKTLENHSSQDGFLHPEDTAAPVKVRTQGLHSERR